MIAIYDGKCPDCGMVIVGGRDEIRREEMTVESVRDGVIANRYGPWRHAVCPEERPVGTCTTCFLQQPCPCGDDQ